MSMQELIQETLAPCCGVGSMLVENHAYLSRHQNQDKKIDDVVFYGQESDLTRFRLCRINLAIHGMDGSRVGWGKDCCFEKDMHPDLRADYILCEPPYTRNGSNFNWNWVRYIISHMARGGVAGIVPGETARRNETREYLVNNGIVKCIVSLPDRLFPETETGTSACLWILAEGKGREASHGDREILFIDVSPGIPAISSDSAESSESAMTGIDEISTTFHRWQGKDCKTYRDVKGFCRPVELEPVRRRHYDLSPEKYV